MEQDVPERLALASPATNVAGPKRDPYRKIPILLKCGFKRRYNVLSAAGPGLVEQVETSGQG
jgi:hypothetical protein